MVKMGVIGRVIMLQIGAIWGINSGHCRRACGDWFGN